MEAFKFPDEVEAKADTEEKLEIEIEGAEIEVVDDTPEEDRGRKPMREAPAEVTDEELESYSEGVKKRIQHFSKGYHEERRAKEAALREREEALRLARSLVEENKKLQGSVGQSQEALLNQAKKTVAADIEAAKRALKEAHETGDTDAFVAAQEQLAEAKIRSDRINTFRPPALQAREIPVQNNVPVQQAPVVQPDSRAMEWREANPWFGSDTEKTALALAVHDRLVKQGVNPASDEYYERIDARIREVFPDAAPQKSRRPSVVAPATRSTAPKKIVLTQSQVNIAKRLGLTNEQYARAVAEEMRKQNG